MGPTHMPTPLALPAGSLSTSYRSMTSAVGHETFHIQCAWRDRHDRFVQTPANFNIASSA